VGRIKRGGFGAVAINQAERARRAWRPVVAFAGDQTKGRYQQAD
jgi:hypothetical protein